MAYQTDENELGSLWVKNGPRGEYMTGEINGVKVVCFPVNHANPKAPTWRVLKSKPKAAAPDQRYAGQEPDDDDIGF